ncbi:alpha-amylase family glycosyl hydrolase [Psychrobium sp. MM17-31]|uniref:alpha-amylase family glycosyl hydrolase n=1 Tax=Psychrobium sp. MM17-31 TaxID=2917758 RepID=UPI001EF4EA19|nr:alpha-amylase family glycosyl hydrolase [Psychrobium sp. MM17-31]MCG7530428.1 alpha-amylase family glycosyl hydrolase [Psychrobium sp. MM17-31]
MMKKTLLTLSISALLFGCDSENTEAALVSKTNTATEQTRLLHVPSPQWQDQIIYFTMTDRFADGDTSNNDQGLGEYDPTRESHYSGGDIKGLINNLDYIKNLGATALWTTPLVANQWWSAAGNYGGYHGYWATDFSAVDAHVGTLDDYQELSHQLHTNGMYLIQDIVVNHTGNFFNYKGGQAGYDSADTAKNFTLLVPQDAPQPAPVQAPFDLIDRNNPEHVAADIYNWTPSITDFNNQSQQYTYQLASLADINTRNPVVINNFKKIYGDWIKNVGVDAFRIDTVRYVEHEFFNRFMHDSDGIHAAAKSTGRDHFLAFGEVFETSEPYENKAEQSITSYLDSSGLPQLNSVISFPLHHDLKTVFAQGFPTAHLAYRIEQHMKVYDNPYVVPTFIDNHDMGRFLATGDLAGFKQALATILTIPGIPTIYQGSAQAMTESRQAMFKGGFMAQRDYFNQDSEMFKFIARLAKLRTSDNLFTRGDLKIITANKNGSGALAYTRSYQGRTVLVMFNTSRNPILLDSIKVSDQAEKLRSLFGEFASMQTNQQGLLTTQLPGRAIIIAELDTIDNQSSKPLNSIAISPQHFNKTVSKNVQLTGNSTFINSQLHIVKNTRLDNVVTVNTDANGRWQYEYPVVNLGQELVSLVAYHPATQTTSNSINFTTEVTDVDYRQHLDDPANDDTGLTGKLTAPQHDQSKGQQDITAIDAVIGGDVLSLTLTMKELTYDWLPANGFDNVAFSIFIDLGKNQGQQTLPMINAQMPHNWQWDLGHVVYGWGNTTFSPVNSNAENQGDKFGIAPQVVVDKEAKTIKFIYRGSDFDVSSWKNAKLYITTWDITGEGAYRQLQPTPSPWNFGGGPDNGAKILDSAELELVD